jgi:hypothetical protein
MTPDLLVRLSAAMQAGRIVTPDGYASEGVTGPEKLRLKSPELRQLRQLRVENNNSEKINTGSELSGDIAVAASEEGSPAAGRDRLLAEGRGSTVEFALAASRDSSDRSCSGGSNFFGDDGAEGVTGVTIVTTDTYASNRLRPLVVTDPFAPVPYGSYGLPFAKLQTACPPSVEPAEWRQAIIDSRDFHHSRGRTAAYNGWTASEL